MDRELLETLRRRAPEEGREEYEILEETARFYLEHGKLGQHYRVDREVARTKGAGGRP